MSGMLIVGFVVVGCGLYALNWYWTVQVPFDEEQRKFREAMKRGDLRAAQHSIDRQQEILGR